MSLERGAFGGRVSFFQFWFLHRQYAFSTNRPQDITYFDHWGTGPGYYKHQVGDRLFFIRRYKETLKQIDRPKTDGALFRHPSEKEWSLPQTHERHFLNFPIGTFFIPVL